MNTAFNTNLLKQQGQQIAFLVNSIILPAVAPSSVDLFIFDYILYDAKEREIVFE